MTNTPQEYEIHYIQIRTFVVVGYGYNANYSFNILIPTWAKFTLNIRSEQSIIFATYDDTRETVLQWVFSPKHTKYHRRHDKKITQRWCIISTEKRMAHNDEKATDIEEEITLVSVALRNLMEQYTFDVWLAFVYRLWSATCSEWKQYTMQSQAKAMHTPIKYSKLRI